MCKLVRPISITIHIFALHKNSNIDNNNIIIICIIIIISRNQMVSVHVWDFFLDRQYLDYHL